MSAWWSRSRPGPYGWWITGLTVLAGILWLQRIASNPLFIDEAASWSVASRPSLGGFWHELTHQEVAPPPFYIALRLVVDAIGVNGHAAMRVPVLLLTLPCVPLAAAVTCRCGGGERTAVLAALLVVCSPLMLMYAQQVRAFGPAATATLLAVLLTLRAADQRWPARTTLVAGVALGLAPWVHYVAWVPLLPVLAWALLGAPRAGRRRVLLGVVPGWVTAAAFAVVQYANVGAGMDDETALSGDDLRRVLAGAWDGRFADDRLLSLLGLLGLIAAVVASVILRGRGRAIALAGLAGPAVIVLVSAAGPDIVTTRYLVPAAPLTLIAIALLLDRIPSRPAAIAAAVVLIAIAGAGVLRSLTPRTGDYPDFERVVGYAVPSLRPGSVIASESFFVGTWIGSYVAAQSGVADVRTAWGLGQLTPYVCGRHRVLQLADPAAAAQSETYWRAVGYTTQKRLTPGPEYVLIIAEPSTPAAPPGCPDARQP